MKSLKFELFTTAPAQKWSQKTIEGLNKKTLCTEILKNIMKNRIFFADTTQSFFFCLNLYQKEYR